LSNNAKLNRNVLKNNAARHKNVRNRNAALNNLNAGSNKAYANIAEDGLVVFLPKNANLAEKRIEVKVLFLVV